MTYNCISNEDGDAIKNGPLTIRGSLNLSPNSYTQVKASYGLTANYSKGKLNGAIKGVGSTYYKKINQSVESKYSLTGSFINGVPNGNFVASYEEGTSYSENVNVTYKDGKLTGSYIYKMGKSSISGTISSNGKLTGTWKMKGASYVFQNGVLIKQDDGEKSTPNSLQEISRKLANNSITVEQLEKDGYICVNESFEFGREMEYILSECYGLPECGGYEFPEPYEISYIEVQRPVTFTDKGFQQFLKYYKEYCEEGFGYLGFGHDKLRDLLHRHFDQSDDNNDYWLKKNADGKYVTYACIVNDNDVFKDYKPHLPAYQGLIYLTDEQVAVIIPMRDSILAAAAEAARIAEEKALAEKAAAEAAAAEAAKKNVYSSLDFLVKFSIDEKTSIKIFGADICLHTDYELHNKELYYKMFIGTSEISDIFERELGEYLKPLLPLSSYEEVEYSNDGNVKCSIVVGQKKKAKKYILRFKHISGRIDLTSISLEE